MLHQKAFKEINLNQRTDLLMKPSTPAHPIAETHMQWLVRLEQVLIDATRAQPIAKPQPELDV